jgi:hypothetical protein
MYNHPQSSVFLLTAPSAFWGMSFVDELKRISAHGERKLKLRRASLAKSMTSLKDVKPVSDEPRSPSKNGDVNGKHTDSVSKTDQGDYFRKDFSM